MRSLGESWEEGEVVFVVADADGVVGVGVVVAAGDGGGAVSTVSACA